jgi:hypothetical protein
MKGNKAMISNNLLEELQKIFIEEFNIHLSMEDTKRLGEMLLTYFKALTQIEENSQKGGEQ